ncbi:MAG TPA: KH domain-containing protein [Candidatus Bathyarchaeia archaeon]|nr:KH domain-containing protein [Candidatus Bathyarchaeia archaeon]
MVKELVEYIVKTLVDKPELVAISFAKRGNAQVLEISVDPSDRGKVIGREGQTIKALRSLVYVATTPDKKITVDLVRLPQIS